MTASTSLRSWSACHRATGSPPARRTARAASTSSREPGKVMTPMRTAVLSDLGACYSGGFLLGWEVHFDVLDDGVGQQRLGDLLQLRLVRRPGDVEHEVLALADAPDPVMAEPAERAEHRMTLGVGDLRLQDDVYAHPRHADEGTYPAGSALAPRSGGTIRRPERGPKFRRDARDRLPPRAASKSLR